MGYQLELFKPEAIKPARIGFRDQMRGWDSPYVFGNLADAFNKHHGHGPSIPCVLGVEMNGRFYQSDVSGVLASYALEKYSLFVKQSIEKNIAPAWINEFVDLQWQGINQESWEQWFLTPTGTEAHRQMMDYSSDFHKLTPWIYNISKLEPYHMARLWRDISWVPEPFNLNRQLAKCFGNAEKIMQEIFQVIDEDGE